MLRSSRYRASEVARLSERPAALDVGGGSADPHGFGGSFRNVFIEAMSCGLPVVASRHGSAPELVSEEAGRLVSIGPEEVAGLADSVIELTNDRERLAASSRAAIEQAKRFTIEASVAGTLAVYDLLLAANGVSARK